LEYTRKNNAKHTKTLHCIMGTGWHLMALTTHTHTHTDRGYKLLPID